MGERNYTEPKQQGKPGDAVITPASPILFYFTINYNLDTLAVSLETQHKESGKKSFLVKTSAKDKTTKLKFDIVLDILNTKVEEMQAAQDASEVKET